MFFWGKIEYFFGGKIYKNTDGVRHSIILNVEIIVPSVLTRENYTPTRKLLII